MVDLQIKKYSWIWLSILLMWLLKLSEVVFEINLAFLGIAPREFKTLSGIVTVFFIHGDFAHILSNTSSFLILSVILVYSYPKIAFKLFILITIITGLLVWLFARGGTYHIGASGVVYGIAAFLFFSGFFRKDKLSMVISLIVALFYGSMIWGVLPIQKGVSWESHLLGGIVGVVLAYLYKDYNKLIPQVSWKEEDLEDRSFKHFMEEKAD